MWSRWKNTGYQLQSKHISGVNQPLKTHICPMRISLFSSHRLVFPALVPVPAPFPQSGRHRSVPWLYLFCVLWHNRGKWQWRWRGPRAMWLCENKQLLSYRARCDKVGRCGEREREPDENHHPQWGAQTGSPPTLSFTAGLLLLDTVWWMVHHLSKQDGLQFMLSVLISMKFLPFFLAVLMSADWQMGN